MKHSPANRPMTSRDQLYSEIVTRFNDQLFRKSEDVPRQNKGAIWIDGYLLSQTPTGTLHPDLEILLEKYEAWVEHVGSGCIIHVPLCEASLSPTKKRFGNFAFRNIKLAAGI
jgi:hypothetical protein